MTYRAIVKLEWNFWGILYKVLPDDMLRAVAENVASQNGGSLISYEENGDHNMVVVFEKAE